MTPNNSIPAQQNEGMDKPESKKCYTVYSSRDRVNFEWEAGGKNIPEAVQELGKWLNILAMRLDPNLAKEEKWPAALKEHWYIFEGKNNIDGKMRP